MKTKYILHGGLAHIPNEMNDIYKDMWRKALLKLKEIAEK